MPKVAVRPAAHFLDLAQIDHILESAWNLATHDRQTYGNALRVEVAVMTGLRLAELHNLRPVDLRDNGTVQVRMGKGRKPRQTAFLNGGARSPTLAVLRRFIEGENRPGGVPVRPEGFIWTSQPPAWHHWVVHRLGPASGLQRRIACLNGSTAAPRYLIHPHLFRSCFVILARRYPRTIGREPVSWPTICDWLGHTSVDTTRAHYWYSEEDENLAELARAIPAELAPEARRAPVRFSPRAW